jgi:predicted nucleic acid-binding OB-fold protein
MSRGPYILKKQGRSRFVSLKNNQNLVKDNHYTKTEIYKRLIAELKDTLFGQLPEKQDPS